MYNLTKKLIAFILCAVQLTAVVYLYPKAAGVSDFSQLTQDKKVYKLNNLPTFRNRTDEDIAQKYAYYENISKTYIDGEVLSYYHRLPSLEMPYSEGSITTDTARTMQGMTDFYRWLSGSPQLLEDSMPADYLQHQAFDRNFCFDHYLSGLEKPADMADAFWEKGVECQHHVLACGYTPQGSITAYMNEGYDLETGEWTTLGHRYSLITPDISRIDFGFCGEVSIGHITQRTVRSSGNGFYGYPAPGNMPSELVDPKHCEWELIMDGGQFSLADISDVVVRVTNLTTDIGYTCTVANGGIDPKNTTTGSVGFCQPGDYAEELGMYTDNYKVEISGYKDTRTGSAAKIVYTVNFFSLSDYM